MGGMHLWMMVAIHQRGRQLRCPETYQIVSVLMKMKVVVLDCLVDLNPETQVRGIQKGFPLWGIGSGGLRKHS